jgi:hypothetical protein
MRQFAFVEFSAVQIKKESKIIEPTLPYRVRYDRVFLKMVDMVNGILRSPIIFSYQF